MGKPVKICNVGKDAGQDDWNMICHRTSVFSTELFPGPVMTQHMTTSLSVVFGGNLVKTR
jgi:hypothetical protein